MKDVKEFYIDPATGSYMDDEMPAMDPNEMMAATSDPEVDMEMPAQVVQLAAPTVNVYFKDLAQVNLDPSCDDLILDISFCVEIFCNVTQKIIDSGVVVKRIKLSKQSLAQQLICRTASTPITEDLITTSVQEIKKAAEVTIKEGSADAAQKTIKRMRELAGIAAKGTFV